jgi:hypothetical protein
MPRGSAVTIIIVGGLLAMPAIVYDLYYSKLLGEPIWLYRMRTVPGTELLAAGAGFLAGWAQARIGPRLRLSVVGKRYLIPVVLAFTLVLPYLKPLLRPLDVGSLRDQWKGEACLQSTYSTCGPASAATIVRRLGGRLSERELAKEAFTSRSGTENWYLARALRHHGFKTSFVLSNPSKAPLPAIVGVRLKTLGDFGHFIALLERSGEQFVIADPMEGFSTNALADLETRYRFTGFFLAVQTAAR